MKYIISILLLMSMLGANAQKKLINRDIYNFEVGDVIHTELTQNSAPLYVKRHFIEKRFSLLKDSLFFKVLDSVYNYNNMKWDLVIENKEIRYINLDSFPRPFDQNDRVGPKYIKKEIMSFDSCGIIKNYYEFETIPDTVIALGGESFYETSLEGLGKYYTHRYEPQSYAYFRLLYYKKNGLECGQKINPFTSIARVALLPNQIYPNPFSQQFTLNMEGMKGKKTIKMYDCKGQLVLDTETNENNLTLAPEINEGVYFVTIMNGDKISVGRVVKLK